MSTNNVFEIRSLLQNAQSVLIALADNYDEDTAAAGLALYMMLQKMKKQPTILASEPVKVEISHLFSVDKIANQFSGGNTLVVSMPYKEGTIEKVSYNIDGDRFNLVIEPRGKSLDFDPNQIQYQYGKGDFDLVIVLGAHNVSALGKLYENHKNIFTQKPLVNIDKSQNNTQFGRINIVADAPISQSVAELSKDLRLPIDQDAASNLYTGIMNHYGSVTIDMLSPQAMDSLSYLGRMQARNLKKSAPSEERVAKNEQIEENTPIQEIKSQTIEPEEQQAPEDWLKPKIFTTNKQDN